ncbi:MAG: hypothetical protein C5B49_11010 [Bdellovibrio sp.]|nr:MAG: hypothetical protein C5B49_11010 [Bdellovibrio sp.]
MKRSLLDVFPSVMELARLMKTERRFVDSSLLQRGQELITIFEDPNFTNLFKDLREQKINAVAVAARDVAEGVGILRTSTIGVAYVEGFMAPFTSIHGSSPAGIVTLSISWSDKRAFQSWRSNLRDEVAQEDVNAGLYTLAHFLSTVIG